jgi:argininosuccinate lyase
VAAGLSLDVGVLAEQAVSHFTAAADLAEELSLRFRLDYRTAYRVVGRAVADALSRGGTELTADGVRAAAEQITGAPVLVTQDLLSAATDPMSAVLARDGLGGASPRRVRQHAQRVRRRVVAARRWNSDRRDRIARAESVLVTTARALASGQ